MRLSSTSTQRTYRYVRLSIIGAVVLLAVSLVAVFVSDGPLTSISALVYTPGRSVFVGVLFAVAVALVALSGHSVEQALLDLAALFAPVIAIVPTTVVTGDAPGLVVDCATPCVPPAELPGIGNGMLSLAVVGALGVLAALVLALVQHTLSRGVGIAIAAAAVIVTGLTWWSLAAPVSFTTWGHFVATAGLFGLIAAASVVSAVTARRPWSAIYIACAAGILLSLAFLAVVFGLRLAGAVAGEVPLVLIGEALLVLFFTVFWLAQTIQKWDETNPSILPEYLQPRSE
ncbi:MAG TPA: hypothetical protein VFN24_05520 [Microbacterium sp.]|nr:hypothetical protein [Microbacterium sp.]